MSAAKPTIRLQAAAALAPLGPGAVVADVAAGRAELALYLASSGLCERVIAIDSSAHAIAAAAGQVGLAQLPVPIELRVGDGLDPLQPGEANVIFVTGIGGRLMIRLLGAGVAAPGDGLARLLRGEGGFAPALVLQPMADPKLVRRWAESRGRGLGYSIVDERLVRDAGRFYHTFVLEVQAEPSRFGSSPLAEQMEAEAGAIAIEEVGPYLLERPDPLIYEYLAWRQAQLENLARKASAGSSETGLRRAGAALTVLAALARLEVALRAGQAVHGGASRGQLPD